jgi:hypothetical protein
MDQQAAAVLHDLTLAAVLRRYGLTDRHALRHVERVYREEYLLVRDLPLADGLEHIAKIAAMELGRPWRSQPRT